MDRRINLFWKLYKVKMGCCGHKDTINMEMSYVFLNLREVWWQVITITNLEGVIILLLE